MYQIFLVIHVIVSFLLVAFILAQSSKGAEITSTTSSSGSVFGSKGSNSFITKTISYLAVLFFSSCLILGTYSNKVYKSKLANIKFETENKNNT